MSLQCQKCNNELEVDSKFCVHCGTPAPESVITQMNDEKPITKTKKFLLKMLAFFIAAFLTMIMKLILMGVGLLEYSADFMKEGVLLFIALWLLLSGFLLKDTGKKKWGFGLLIAYFVLSTAFGYFYNNLDHRATATEANYTYEDNITAEANVTAVEANSTEAIATAEGKVTIAYGTEANSHYMGKYLCNDIQLLEITNKTLTIGNAVFEYYQFVTFQYGVTDVFNKDDNTEGAIMSKTPDREGHYSLNIRSFINKYEPPYVADCTKVK